MSVMGGSRPKAKEEQCPSIRVKPTPSTPSSSSARMRWWGAFEGSEEEVELQEIVTVIEPYERKRWPEGKAPGRKGLIGALRPCGTATEASASTA